jgi:hypothetical protein
MPFTMPPLLIFAPRRRLTSLTAGIVLLAAPAAACSQSAPASSQGAPPGSQDTTASSADPGWPRGVTKDGPTLTSYQPQIDEGN